MIGTIAIRDATQGSHMFYVVDDGVALAFASAPGPRIIVPLDAVQVIIGGTPITAIAPGHRTAGGVLQSNDPAGLFINEVGGAAGLLVSGGTVWVPAGTLYRVTPANTGVSVNSPNAGAIISGWGLQ